MTLFVGTVREHDEGREGVTALGYSAHPDPAGELATVITGIDKHVIVALCGAAGDPQGLDAQRERLEAAGAVVTRSNAIAARLAKEASDG